MCPGRAKMFQFPCAHASGQERYSTSSGHLVGVLSPEVLMIGGGTEY